MEYININEMFEHYIEKKRASRREPQGSYNEAWVAGEAHEAELWLGKYGVDTSFDTINPMIEGKRAVKPVYLDDGAYRPGVLTVVRYHDYSGEDTVKICLSEASARKTIEKEMAEVQIGMSEEGYTPIKSEMLDSCEICSEENSDIYYKWFMYEAEFPKY